jgi:hypothetical protein
MNTTVLLATAVVMDPGCGPEPVIGPRYARTRWGHPPG